MVTNLIMATMDMQLDFNLPLNLHSINLIIAAIQGLELMLLLELDFMKTFIPANMAKGNMIFVVGVMVLSGLMKGQVQESFYNRILL